MPCLVLTCLLIAAFKLIFADSVNYLSILAALTYTTNWVRAFSNYDLNGLSHCWSLAIEEQYYLIWPLIISVLYGWSKSNVFNGCFLLAVSFLLAFYRFSMVGVLTKERIHFGLDTHMDGIVLGAAIACFFFGIGEESISEKLHKVLSWVFTPIAILVLVLIMWRLKWWDPWMGRVGYALVSMATAILVIDLVKSRKSLIRRILEFSPLVYFGRISYGIYLLHPFVFMVVDHFTALNSGLASKLVKFLLCLIAASISFHLVEAPVLRLKRFFKPNLRSID